METLFLGIDTVVEVEEGILTDCHTTGISEWIDEWYSDNREGTWCFSDREDCHSEEGDTWEWESDHSYCFCTDLISEFYREFLENDSGHTDDGEEDVTSSWLYFFQEVEEEWWGKSIPKSEYQYEDESPDESIMERAMRDDLPYDHEFFFRGFQDIFPGNLFIFCGLLSWFQKKVFRIVHDFVEIRVFDGINEIFLDILDVEPLEGNGKLFDIFQLDGIEGIIKISNGKEDKSENNHSENYEWQGWWKLEENSWEEETSERPDTEGDIHAREDDPVFVWTGIRENIPEGGNIIHFFGDTVTYGCNQYGNPTYGVSEEPVFYVFDGFWCDSLTDNADNIEYLEEEGEEDSDSDELWYGSYDEESFCGNMFLEDSERNVYQKGNEVSDSEKYSDECNIFQEDGEKIHHGEMKKHPSKPLKNIGNIKILEFISGKSSIRGDYDGVVIFFCVIIFLLMVAHKMGKYMP